MVGLKKERIMQGLAILAKQPPSDTRIVRDYEVPCVAEKVLRVIGSYTDYVNRVVWGSAIEHNGA